MSWKRTTRNEGFTLLELTLAVGIFAVAIGVAAQSLISFYATMDMQHQRTVAVQHCRAILSDMRSVRDAHPNTEETPTNFQTAVLAQFPEATIMTGPPGLANAELEINYEDPSPTANPLAPTVTVRWEDLRGRQISAAASSALTDR